ncbi:hypothetical protein LWI28_025026 [Acer negundo]|uniref:Uncharacterized protein n=1 Tax=Acer negundo TaxID=4023 RepID=A0AAD5JBF2_ACENE|nr:hypothetical protein LWI28_025026 [Acer negundo]KAK4852886.1 hypothetical protein QYF36_000750 [Acer negundo]
MGRSPRCSKDVLIKGAWVASEDKILRDYIKVHGEGKWSNVAKKTGLKRCGKSCRLRWMNYLRPDIKRGNISIDEEELIIRLHKLLGNRWSLIAGRLPGRTDNEIKNYWNTNLAKRAPDDLDEINKTPPLVVVSTTSTTGAVNGSDPDPDFGMPRSVLPPSSNLEPAKNIIIRNYNNNGSDDGSPSYLSRENPNNSSSDNDLIMDFNVDDFCKIFDSDYGDYLDVNYDHQTTTDCLVDQQVGDGDHHQYDIIMNVMSCKTEDDQLPSNYNFPEKIMKENYDRDMDSEFLTLASSFLESAVEDEGWPGYDLNISTHATA